MTRDGGARRDCGNIIPQIVPELPTNALRSSYQRPRGQIACSFKSFIPIRLRLDGKSFPFSWKVTGIEESRNGFGCSENIECKSNIIIYLRVF